MLRNHAPSLAVLLVTLLLRDGTSAAAEDTKPVPPAPHNRAKLVVQTGHSSAIDAVAFSPDGKLALTGSIDNSARLWDVQSGKQIHVLEGSAASVTSAVFSPDGKLVLAASLDGTARLWEVQSGKLLHTLKGHTFCVWTVAFSPDSKLALTGSNDDTARLWDVQSGKQVHSLQGHTRWLTSVAFGPDSKFALTVSLDGTARLWDVQSGKQIRTFEGHTEPITTAVFSPDGTLVVTGSWDRTARLWETQSGKLLHTLQGHTDGLDSVAFSADGKLVATGSQDKTARLWEVQSGKQLHALPGHSDKVSSVAFSPDGKLVLTGCADHSVRIWDARGGKLLHTLQGRSTRVWSVHFRPAFSPDGKLVLAASENQSAQLWDVQSGNQLHVLGGPMELVLNTAFSPDGYLVLTASLDATARLWDVHSGKQIHTLKGHTGLVTSMAFSPDGRLVLTSSEDKTARLWEVQNGKLLHTLQGHTRGVAGAAFSPDGKLVVTGSLDGTARIWQAQSGKELRILKGHADWVGSVAFSPDGKLVLTGSWDNTARLWDAQSGNPLHTLQGHTSGVSRTAFSADGKFVLTGGGNDPIARLWDAQSGNLLHPFPGHEAGVWSIAFSPDGKLLATGSLDGTARLWQAQSGKQLHVLREHTDWVNTVTFSPDGKLVLTSSADNTARLWEVHSGKLLHTLRGHTAGVTSAAFSPDGKRIVTGSRDKTTRLWDVQSAKELCQMVSFTDGTWAVVDPEGRFDASNGGDVDGLHWVVGLEPIALKQLKERYYEPGLLAKHLGYNKEPLRKVETFRDVKLYPAIAVAQKDPKRPQLDVTLTNRGGGIGRVVVLVNGKEVTADLRPRGADADAAKLALHLDLSHDPRLIPGAKNKVEVLAFNGEGYLSSRGFELEVVPPGNATVELPTLHAIVVGISDYGNEKLKLRFAAKDAEDFATALQLGGKRLFGAEKVHLALLTTSDHPGAIRPTKENIAKAFAELKKAKPGDIVVVYLAGHGAALQQGKDLYCYLTCDARSLDPAVLSDPAVREATTVSSEELGEWTRQIPALKQVMVLDTCAAGAAAVKLTEKREVSGDQIRAIERLKDRTGFHVLMGCAADRVSYEASQYAQGLLTYSLLEGMRGTALREGEFVDVSKLFRYAEDRVPELSRNIGGVQRPLVAAPRGSSFDVGRLATEDRAQVPLALVKPLVLKPVLINRDADEDDLKLTALLRERLAEASRPAVRGKAPAIVYVPEDDFPGAVRPTGTYGVEGDKVSVRLTLKRDGVVIARPMVEGRKSDLAALADKMAEAVLGAAK